MFISYYCEYIISIINNGDSIICISIYFFINLIRNFLMISYDIHMYNEKIIFVYYRPEINLYFIFAQVIYE